MLKLLDLISKILSEASKYLLEQLSRPSQSPNSSITATSSPETHKEAPLTTAPSPAPKYDWSTPAAARHSVRVICDEEGLTVEQKNLLSRVIHCESGYNIHAKHYNMIGNKLSSTDRGICQWNDFYHGKEISPHDAEFNPEKAVRLMIHYMKMGQLNLWVCYSSKLYLRYSA